MKLFSVILTHYNQMDYIFESLASLLMQDYGRIQLIITDDASNFFDETAIKKYIEENKKTNIDSYKIITNKKNIGTVRTLNKALKSVEGEYVLFYAADDKLFELNVLSRFVKGFEENEDIDVLTSQTYMCEGNLVVDEKTYKFVPTEEALKYNEMSAREQYYYLSSNCYFASGSTAYRKKVFDKMLFDERFILAEDWSYWILLNMNGIKIKYLDFVALLHRTGGISHLVGEEIPEHVKVFYLDDLRVYTDLIFPNFKEFPNELKYKILDKYMWYLDYYETIMPGTKENNKEHTEKVLKTCNYSGYLRKKELKEKREKTKLFIKTHINIKVLLFKYLVFLALCFVVFYIKKIDYINLLYISIAYFMSLFISKILIKVYRRYLR